MKKLRPTRSKTRIGVLNWLAKLNPRILNKQRETSIYNDSSVVAVHVHTISGTVVHWELSDGTLMTSDEQFGHTIPFFSVAA